MGNAGCKWSFDEKPMSADRHVTLRMEEGPLDLAIESLSFSIAAIAFKASQG